MPQNKERQQNVKKRYSHTNEDTKIHRNRYYVWCYNDKYQVNLLPISWQSRALATTVLTKLYGKDIFKTLNLIKGSKAIKSKMVLGYNSFTDPVTGLKLKARKFYIPPEWSINKHTRRHFMLRLYRKPPERLEKIYYKLIYKTKDEKEYL